MLRALEGKFGAQGMVRVAVEHCKRCPFITSQLKTLRLLNVLLSAFDTLIGLLEGSQFLANAYCREVPKL